MSEPVFMDQIAPGLPLPVIRCPRVSQVALDTKRELALETEREEILARNKGIVEVPSEDVLQLGRIKIELEAIRRRAAMRGEG